MKVTSVEPQKSSKGRSASGRNPRRFNVFLDGTFAFGADEDLIVNRRLVIGKEILPEDLNKILFEAEIGKLMERMYRLFGIRQRSEKEVRDYFRIKLRETSQLVIDATIETLKKKEIINDEQFAKAWVEARSKKYGINRIRQELAAKGIFNYKFEISNEETAQQALEKKIRIWKNLDPLQFKKKAYELLLRRGFEYSVIEKVIKEVYNKTQ